MFINYGSQKLNKPTVDYTKIYICMNTINLNCNKFVYNAEIKLSSIECIIIYFVKSQYSNLDE